MKKNRLVSRLIQMCVVLIGISFLTFLLTYLAPGDPATAMYDSLGITPSPEMLEQARQSMGLDKPFLQQYVDWIGGIFHGDFGTSFSKSAPVLELLMKRLPATFRLALFSLGLMLIVSVPLGILSAVKQDGIADYIVRFLSFLGISLPGFLIGLILLYVFALKLGLVKVASSSVGMEQMLLPGITVAIAMASKYSRQVRTAVLEELHQDYVTGARARGMNQWEILFRQVLPNAMLPLVTMLGAILWIASRRNLGGGDYFFLSGTGDPGGGSGKGAGLSADPGLRIMDSPDLYGGKSAGGYILSLY